MSGRSSSGPAIAWIVAIVGLLAATIWLGSGDAPYRLESTGDSGYRGLALLLEEQGVDVRSAEADDLRSGSLDDVDVVYVTGAAEASEDDAALLWDLAASGSRVVVGGGLPDDGERTGLEPVPADIFATPLTDTCNMAELVDVVDVDPYALFGTSRFDATTADGACLGDGNTALVARIAVGDGDVVAVGTPELFTNLAMGAPAPSEPVGRIPDNALLAQRLLAPDGAVSAAVISAGVSGPALVTGGKGPADFISDGVKLALGQLVVVFVLFAWLRGRHHGAPVIEAQPVSVASSELVDAVGNLLERQGDPGRAASRIRGRVTSELTRRLALPPDTTPDVLARIVASRTGRDPADVADALYARGVGDNAALVDLVGRLDLIRQEALHDRSTLDHAR